MKNEVIKSIKQNLGYKSLGSSIYNIYDYHFYTKICINGIPYPLVTQVKYFYNHPINSKKEKNFLTLIGKKDDKNCIEVTKNDTIGFIINVRDKGNCKEINIINKQNIFKITQMDLPKNNQIISYIRISNNTSICISQKQDKFYIYSINHKINKSLIESIFLPYLGENTCNPLFKIKNWEIELIINNNIIPLGFLTPGDFFSGYCNHNKCNYLYLSTTKTCLFPINSKFNYKIFFTFNNQKHLLKKNFFIFTKDKIIKNNEFCFLQHKKDLFDIIPVSENKYHLNFGVIKIKTLQLLKHIYLSN
jgi:hypothetical protein